MSDDKVNLNQATVAELAVLPGIGQKLAAKIVAYRQEQGDFTALEDLTAVSGISSRMAGNLKEHLIVGTASPDIEAPEITAEPSDLGEDVASSSSDISAGEASEDNETLPGEEDLVETPPGPDIVVSPEGEAVVLEVGSEQELETRLEEETQEPSESVLPSFEEGETEPDEELPDEEEPESDMVSADESVDIATPAEEEVEEPEATAEDELEEEAIILLEPRVAEPLVGEEAAPRLPASTEKEGQSALIVGYVLSALAGAFLGAVLVLFFLLVVNGTLRFAGNTRANDFQRRMDDDISTLDQGQADLQATTESLSGDLRVLDERLATVAADQVTLGAAQEDLQADVSSLDEEMQSVGDDLGDLKSTIATLEEETAAMDERLQQAAESAEAFDAFLNGMRDLLQSLQAASPESSTPETQGTASPTATVVPGASATAAPTRTPRPTATPLTLPSPTPRS